MKHGWDTRGMKFDKTDFSQFRKMSEMQLNTQLKMIEKGHARKLLRNQRRKEAKEKDHDAYKDWQKQAIKYNRRIAEAEALATSREGIARTKVEATIAKLKEDRRNLRGDIKFTEQWHKEKKRTWEMARELPEDASKKEIAAKLSAINEYALMDLTQADLDKAEYKVESWFFTDDIHDDRATFHAYMDEIEAMRIAKTTTGGSAPQPRSTKPVLIQDSSGNQKLVKAEAAAKYLSRPGYKVVK
jgi:hypothetical protein